MAGTAFHATSADDAHAAELMAGLVRRIASSLDLRETLQLVAQAVVDQLGFGAAAVSLVRPGDMCEVAAVAGPEDAADAMLGTRAPMETFRRILANCEPWGDLRFLDHRRDQGLTMSVAAWVPPILPSEDSQAWHPDDILLAPLHAPDGALIGVLSVDMPEGGLFPGPRPCQLLEQFAAHAALAIEHARVHTLAADSEQLFRAMFDRSPVAIALLTEEMQINRVNAAYERLLGRDAADLVGSLASELARPAPAGRRRGAEPRPDQYEVHFIRPDGIQVWGRVNRTLLPTEARDGPRLVLTQIEDITQLRMMQARFAHAATHDQLTGLANRALVLDQLTEALADARQGGGPAAVLLCDVDHFSEINDTLGHAEGDQLLVTIGRRLARAASEQHIVGRFGGDEFVLVAWPVATAAEAASLADRVMRRICQPVTLGGEPVLPSLSIGVAIAAPQDNADTVLAAAAGALYAAKSAGRGRWHLAPAR